MLNRLTRTILFLLIIPFSINAQNENLEEIIEYEKRFFKSSKIAVNSTIGKEYDLSYHRMNWNIDPAVNYISGSIYSEFAILESTSILNFDLNDNMQVDSVIYHGSSAVFTLTNDVLSITLGTTLIPGQIDSVIVYYQGTPASSGFGSWLASNHSTGPIISTLSEPYGAREWWPCKQSLDDKIDSLDIFIKTPSQYLSATNGVLVSSVIDGSDKIMHWKHKFPITCYLIAISVSNYVEFSNYLPLSSGDSLEILNYCYPQSLSTWQNLSTEIVGLLQLYDSLFEPYPFMTEKYGHAEWEWGGGMEHQTMSFMGTLNLGLMAHEVAHQWFGDKITCGSWQDIWLNEGFATYLTGLAFENGFGIGSNLWHNWKSSVISSATSQPGGSVFVDDTSSVSRIFSGRLSYNKGALLLHMLRWKMGDSTFFSSLQSYLQDSSLAFSYAKTDDLKFHLEQTSGMNLDEFFNDWLYGQGYPNYNLHLAKNSNGEYELTVGQTSSHSSVSFFEMPIAVEFRGLGVDTTIVFNHTSDGQVFTFNLPFRVWSYEFDPEMWICAKSTEILSLDNFDNSTIKVYPNPSKGRFTVSNLKSNPELNEIYVLDYSGKVIDAEIKKISRTEIRINIRKQVSGIYYLKIRDGNSIVSAKIILED